VVKPIIPIAVASVAVIGAVGGYYLLKTTGKIPPPPPPPGQLTLTITSDGIKTTNYSCVCPSNVQPLLLSHIIEYAYVDATASGGSPPYTYSVIWDWSDGSQTAGGSSTSGSFDSPRWCSGCSGVPTVVGGTISVQDSSGNGAEQTFTVG
jgi:hypothetical protein